MIALHRLAIALMMFAFVTSMTNADDLLFVSKPLTKPQEFTGGIEGAACDTAGNIYAVNFSEQGTIGRVTPDGKGSIFVTLDNGSIGNGIRFARNGDMFIADYTNHNILRVAAGSKKPTVFAHNDTMNQPNDLAMAPNGVLYASDPNWSDGTGQLWRINRDGEVTRIATDLGTTNGVEVSPDGKTIYVNESKQRNVWAFTITPQGVQDKRLIKQFPDHGFDGMRCDVDGNLYITRYGKGTVVKMTPQGEILQEIDVLDRTHENGARRNPPTTPLYTRVALVPKRSVTIFGLSAFFHHKSEQTSVLGMHER